jgi:hypothetical protein
MVGALLDAGGDFADWPNAETERRANTILARANEPNMREQ